MQTLAGRLSSSLCHRGNLSDGIRNALQELQTATSARSRHTLRFVEAGLPILRIATAHRVCLKEGNPLSSFGTTATV